MATNNAVNTSLSGQTGTGSFAGSISPTFTTPTLGVATATSLGFSPTTNGVVGTPTNDSASAGYVGELISSIVLFGSATSLSTGVAKNITSILLPAGDWDVFGNVGFTGPASTVVNQVGWISSTSATLPDQALRAQNTNSGTGNGMAVTNVFQLPSPTTIYLSALSNFSGGTLSVFGYIYARRRR